jgi:pimeloyl-ACP methyl ester carboxylesterase
VPEAILEQQSRCPVSPSGYALIEGTDAEAAADFFHDADPAVVADVVGHRPADSCGGIMNAGQAAGLDVLEVGSVTVPVLTVAGEQDAFFPNAGPEAQLFTSSSNVDTASLPDTGHALTLGRTAPAFRAAMESWLARNGLSARSARG